MEKLLGTGTFGKTFRVSSNSTKYLAFKIQLLKYHNESEIHKKLVHKHVVKLVADYKCAKFSYIFLEYCPNGCLQDLVKARKGLTPYECRYFT